MRGKNTVAAVLEEDSSFQNGRVSVTGIVKRGASGQISKIDLDDGSFFFVSSLFIEEKEIREGAVLSPEIADELAYQAHLLQVKEKSLDLLQRAEQSEGLLRQKLLKRHFDSAIIEETINWLTKKGFLNNERYAEEWTISRLKRRPEGKPAILAGLRRRGVDRKTAEKVINRVVTPEKEADALERAVQKACRRYEDEKKIYRSLVRKGFKPARVEELLKFIEK